MDWRQAVLHLPNPWSFGPVHNGMEQKKLEPLAVLLVLFARDWANKETRAKKIIY